MLKFHQDILKEFEQIGRKTKIILYGSLARGEYRLDSDIDLAIITDDKNLMELATSIADKILMEYGKLVSIKFISEEDFNKRKTPLIDEIRRGIAIYDGRKRQNQNKRRA
jgi:predicted nucleotidyltransferase